jgi:LacI family transcriptional regulator
VNHRKRMTIKDVAREAGVSVQTVSRVINNHPDVSPETLSRVGDAIDRLGYSPSAAARRLVQRRSCLIGVVASGHEYHGPSGMAVMGVENQATEFGYSLILQLLHQPERADVNDTLKRLMGHEVDGIVWAVPEIGENRSWWRNNKHDLPVPIVFLNSRPWPGLSVVSIDNRQGGRIATEHLLNHGYRHIGLISGPSEWWEVQERCQGWRDALSSFGMLADNRQIAQGDLWRPETGERAMSVLFERYPEIDAVFACNDHIALGALKVIHQRGLRIPDDIAVVGFDNRPDSAYYQPALTTVHQQMDEVGSLAVRELKRVMDRESADLPVQPSGAILLQPWLVERDSVARVG